MHAATPQTDFISTVLERATAAALDADGTLPSVLEDIAVPIYVTDADGLVTHFNQACVPFTGRAPQAGSDRWCVTWKLYTDDGEFLPHDQCPMADAIRTRQPVRNVTAVAERPNGGRVSFMPFPTPLLDDAGQLLGAINILLDVADETCTEHLEAQAARCRRLASSVDAQTTHALLGMAAEYEQRARALRA